MEQNHVITAPQLNDADTAYKLWRRTNPGNVESFYKFMTTPSPQRDKFIGSLKLDISNERKFISISYR